MERELWNLVLVEDNEQVREEVVDYLEGDGFEFGNLKITEVSDFNEALSLLSERKVDLLVLDVMGNHDRDKTAGIDVLNKWKAVGFSPVIFYTALPESVAEYESALVRVVGKEGGSLVRLREAIQQVFALRIPQTHRAIAQHFDSALREYMWGFVIQNWGKLEELIDRPDFVRLLLQRLAVYFSREGVEQLVEALYPGTTGRRAESELAHPTEYYIKPPFSIDPRLGDIRKLGNELFVVVWPSCDLVTRGGTCKVEHVLCARAVPVTEYPEYREWVTGQSNSKEKILSELMRNNRDSKHGQAERYHFLPGAWDIPASIVDFQKLRHADISEVRSAECIATVSSPFAESISARFVRYLGRIGTPDLDLESCLNDLREKEGLL